MKAMMWYDPDKKTRLDEKMRRAVAFFQNKYGKNPVKCYIHPSMACADVIFPLEVKTYKLVLPNHMWLEIDSG